MKNGKGSAYILWVLLLVPILWCAAGLAQAFPTGAKLDGITQTLSGLLENPFALEWTTRTPKYLLAAVFLYGMGIAYCYAARGNTRPGEEHGSARWASVKQIYAKYQDAKRPENNLIFTQNVRMSMDSHKHRRNLNVLVVGGSGAGKTRFYAKPNIMQANCSYIITDPKAGATRS